MIDPKSLKHIQDFKSKSTGGRQMKYPNLLIEMLLSVKIQFRLSYRALEGFARSVFEKIKRWFSVPSYSNICKRTKDLLLSLPVLSTQKAKVILVDASGIKVYGEGEWKRKIHGVGRPRKWLKMHIAVDERTQEVVAEELTHAGIGDSSMMGALLQQVLDDVELVKADGEYDRYKSRIAIEQKGARALIPPPKNAITKKIDSNRDTAVLQIKSFGVDLVARSLWGKTIRI